MLSPLLHFYLILQKRNERRAGEQKWYPSDQSQCETKWYVSTRAQQARNAMSVGVLGTLLVAAANGYYPEANLAKRVTVEEHAPIKHERGLVHRLVHGAPVDVTEFRPFRCNDDGLAVLRGRKRSLGDGDLF